MRTNAPTADAVLNTTFAGRAQVANFVAIDGVPAKWYVGIALDSDMAYASLNKLRITAIVATLAAGIFVWAVLNVTAVKDLVNNKFIEAQLDECPLTLKDLHLITERFTRMLTAVFHTRTRYPEKDGQAKKAAPTTGKEGKK